MGSRRPGQYSVLAMTITYAIPLLRRFELQHCPVPESGCWLWTGCVNRAGYGRINVCGRVWLAHRASWLIHRGNIPEGMQVCHKCDTPGCVNPDHLFIGTNADNHADKIAKGRQGAARGESHWNAKLTADQVAAIRSDKRLSSTIAREYGISERYVYNLRYFDWRRVS